MQCTRCAASTVAMHDEPTGNDVWEVRSALDRYNELDPNFQGTREEKLLRVGAWNGAWNGCTPHKHAMHYDVVLKKQQRHCATGCVRRGGGR